MNEKLMTEWISTTDDIPCKHSEMCYEMGGMFTDIGRIDYENKRIGLEWQRL